MTSDEERREVAERLRAEVESWRYYREEDNVFCMHDHEFTEAVLEDFGFDDMDMPAYEVFDHMADIVDRPTCQMKRIPKSSYRVCSRCGAFVREDAVTNCTEVIPVKFCPNCDAMVVSE